jgi:nucleoside-diphosphate-sugar epimerase
MGHVDDLVDGTMLAMERAEAVGELINLGNPEEVSVLECARRIHKMAGVASELAVTYVPFEEIFGQYKDIERRRPDIGKAERLLGWKPKLTLEDGLRRTIAARREHLQRPMAPAGT